MSSSSRVVHTVGHSTRSVGELLALLSAYAVDVLVDIRSSPRSRHTPQFNAEALEDELRGRGLAYLHLPGLGGRRRPLPTSGNSGWRNVSFRGYADHMQTAEFRDALDELVAVSEDHRPVIMCAEALPWRCHRSLVGDALIVRGTDVVDIFDAAKSQPHTLTSFAVVEGEAISYPEDRGEA